MKDYAELKMLAEKATPGPWWIDSHGCTMMSMKNIDVVFSHPQTGKALRHEETGNLSHWRNDWDASFIACANPATILALLDELESAKLDARRYQFVRKASDDQSLAMHAIGTQNGLDDYIDAALNSSPENS